LPEAHTLFDGHSGCQVPRGRGTDRRPPARSQTELLREAASTPIVYSMISKPLDQITERDLQDLIDFKVAERKTLDYRHDRD
jgi:hypothetical protein